MKSTAVWDHRHWGMVRVSSLLAGIVLKTLALAQAEHKNILCSPECLLLEISTSICVAADNKFYIPRCPVVSDYGDQVISPVFAVAHTACHWYIEPM